MFQQERHNFILDYIARHQKLVSTELSGLLKVSADTIRRDISDLEREGKILKVHGGAIALSRQQPFQPSSVYKQQEKQKIARKAISLLREGMVILGGGGTIMLEIARLLPGGFRATFFTVSPLVALELTQRSVMDVILLGGNLRRNSYICTGAPVIGELSGIRADICLLGGNAINEKRVSEADWEVAQVKKAMLRVADKKALLCLSEAIGKEEKMTLCASAALDYLVTEISPRDRRLQTLKLKKI